MPLDPLANGMNNGSSPKWAPILGQWEITETSQRFQGEGQRAAAHGQLFPMGLAVSNVAMQNGTCQVKVRFSARFGENMQAGGIVLGYRSPEQHYIFAELGAAQSAYSVGEYVSGFGWRPLATTGQLENLKDGRDYVLQVSLSGQEFRQCSRDTASSCSSSRRPAGWVDRSGKPRDLVFRFGRIE